MKTLLSWIIAFAFAAVALHLLFTLFEVAIEALFNIILLIPLLLIAIPFFLIVRKKLFK
ncbi:MAG: hypothetical protein ACOCX7_04110 [Bacteroidota bacterium]